MTTTKPPVVAFDLARNQRAVPPGSCTFRNGTLIDT